MNTKERETMKYPNREYSLAADIGLMRQGLSSTKAKKSGYEGDCPLTTSLGLFGLALEHKFVRTFVPFAEPLALTQRVRASLGAQPHSRK